MLSTIVLSVCLSVLDVTVYCGQVVGWIKIKLGMEVCLGPDHIVLDGNPASPPQKKGAQPQFLVHVCCGQTAGRIKMPRGMEVGLSPGYIGLDGEPVPPTKRHSSPPLFGPCLLWPNDHPCQLLLSSCFVLFCVVVHFFWSVKFIVSVRFSFSIPSQEIGLGRGRLWNDLFCVEWDVKPQHNRSVLNCCRLGHVCRRRTLAIIGATCLTGSVSFLSLNQQCQSTVGTSHPESIISGNGCSTFSLCWLSSMSSQYEAFDHWWLCSFVTVGEHVLRYVQQWRTLRCWSRDGWNRSCLGRPV